MTRNDTIRERLQNAFAPSQLEVIDESSKHAHHKAMHGVEGGETHFRVKVASAAFTGKSRVERHRMVNDLFADLFAQGLHALAIETKTPE